MSYPKPRVSIVTPSLNQGNFIERTITSVLSQGYPNLELLVIDGGSTDQTLSILQKYTKQIFWISEPDKGQTDALNKGLKMVSGEIIAYLNADDVLFPGALEFVVDAFEKYPEAQWVTGRCRNINEDDEIVRSLIYHYKNWWLHFNNYQILLMTNYIAQPATFWRRSMLDHCGYFDDTLSYVMDYEYWLRMWAISPPIVINQDLAGFRIQRMSKTTSVGHTQEYIKEEQRIIAQYSTNRFWRWLHDIHRAFMTWTYLLINN
jgi:glycosyltransferase involved in cell wall biosynthesis